MGIRRFHRSVKGKRFHRTMGRFLATRMFSPNKRESLDHSQFEVLKAVPSIRTHIYIEQNYFMPLSEEVDFNLFVDYAIPLLTSIESKLSMSLGEDLSDAELELLFRIVNTSRLLSIVQEDYGVKVFEKAKSILSPDDSEDAYVSDFFVRSFRSISPSDVTDTIAVS